MIKKKHINPKTISTFYINKNRISWNELDKNLRMQLYHECFEFMTEYQNNKVWPYCEILIRSRELVDGAAKALGLQHLGGGLVVDT